MLHLLQTKQNNAEKMFDMSLTLWSEDKETEAWCFVYKCNYSNCKCFNYIRNSDD